MRGTKAFLLLFMLLVLASPMATAQLQQAQGFQPPECTSGKLPTFGGIAISNPASSPQNNPFVIALLALTVSIDVIAIGYIISRLLPHTGLRNWLQNEYWEVAKTALLIGAIYGGMLLLLTSFSLAIAPASPGSVPAADIIPGANLNAILHASNTYLCSSANYLVGSWSMAGDMFLGIGFLRSLGVGYYLALPIPDPEGGGQAILFGVSYGVYQNLMLETGQFIIAPYQSIVNDYLQFLLFPTSIIITSEIELLPALMLLGLTFFIPVGLVFRALPFIRGIGGTMIGLGVGMAIIYPAILIGFNYPITNALNNAIPLPEWSVTNPAYPPNLVASSYASSFSAPVSNLPSNVATCTVITSAMAGNANLLSSLIGSVSGFICTQFTHIITNSLAAQSAQNQVILANNYDSASAFGFETLTSMTFFLNYLVTYGVYVIIQLLLFVFDLVMIYSVTDNFAKTLGGTIRFELGGKLRLAS